MAIGIKSLFGLFKGEHKEHKHPHPAPAGGGTAHPEAHPEHPETHANPEKKRGIIGGFFDALTAPSRAFRAVTDALVGLGLLAGIGWAGTRYVQNGFDMKRTGKAMGEDILKVGNKAKDMIRGGIIGVLMPKPSNNTAPQAPHAPNNTPPNNPSNRPSVSPEVLSYRNDKVQALRAKIPSSLDAQFNPILGDLEKK